MTRALVWVVLVWSAHAHAERWLELQLIPISAQVNVLQSEHDGSGARATFHFHRFIGVYVGGLYNWHTSRSTSLDYQYSQFRLRAAPYPATPLATWQLHAGAESIPLEGTFNLGPTFEGRFGLVVSLGFGLGGTRTPLGDPYGTTTYAESEVRPMGHVGLSARFAFGSFAVHLGVHASMWSSVVTRLNGCNLEDLRAQDLAIRAGEDPTLAPVSSGCRFTTANDTGQARLAMVEQNNAVQVNIAAELGLSWSL